MSLYLYGAAAGMGGAAAVEALNSFASWQPSYASAIILGMLSLVASIASALTE